MAVAQLPKALFPASDAPVVERTADSIAPGAGVVRVGVHDASRVEWSVSVPLPTDAELEYAIDVSIEIPTNTIARHSPWDQMQSFTRLDGPALSAVPSEAVTIDALRRGAVALANKLSRSSEGFSRQCRLATSILPNAAAGELEQALRVWLDSALGIVSDTRARLAAPREGDLTELARERTLVDEYVSIRLLEFLSGAERALSSLYESPSPNAERFLPAVAALEERVADALEAEFCHRKLHNYLLPDPRSQGALEMYLDRASRLKKHFQEVLFLEPEMFNVADKFQHWVASVAAVIAAAIAFTLQLFLFQQGGATAGTSAVSSGVLVLALIAGIFYALRDRFKEVGRSWISGKMHRVYGGQRVAKFRAPARRLPGRDIIVNARESFDQTVELQPDALNPESGATSQVTRIRYRHRGRVSPQCELTKAGVRRVKHVFRYDLSPLFARLDDAVKPVPVLDEVTRRVRFIDAPRCYRVPISVKVTCGQSCYDETSTLVLHKRGLERLERKEHDSDPRLMDAGIEPG